MSPLIEEIVKRLQQLPESKVEEVLDFVDALASQHLQMDQTAAREPLLSIAGILSGEPLSSEAIGDEVQPIQAATRSLEESKQRFEQLQQRWQGQLLSNSVDLLREDRMR